MTSDNSKSQINFLDLKIIKIKIQALLLLRFETLLFDSPAVWVFEISSLVFHRIWKCDAFLTVFQDFLSFEIVSSRAAGIYLQMWSKNLINSPWISLLLLNVPTSEMLSKHLSHYSLLYYVFWFQNTSSLVVLCLFINSSVHYFKLIVQA